MGRLQQAGAGLLAVIWLTSCSTPAHEPESPGQARIDAAQPLVMVQGGSTAPLLPNDRIFDLTSRSRAPAVSGDPCDPTLANDLVTRELSRLLGRGETFKNYKFSGEPDEASRFSLQQRVQSFRRERVEHYEKLFACTPGNEGIHQLARQLSGNPNDRKVMAELYVGLIEQRGDEVLALYPQKDFTNLADMMTQIGLNNLRARYADLNDFVQEGALKKAIHDRIGKNQEELALLALKGELIEIFQSANFPQSERFALQLGIQKIVAEEVTQHLLGNIQKKMPFGIDKTQEHTI